MSGIAVQGVIAGSGSRSLSMTQEKQPQQSLGGSDRNASTFIELFSPWLNHPTKRWFFPEVDEFTYPLTRIPRQRSLCASV